MQRSGEIKPLKTPFASAAQRAQAQKPNISNDVRSANHHHFLASSNFVKKNYQTTKYVSADTWLLSHRPLPQTVHSKLISTLITPKHFFTPRDQQSTWDIIDRQYTLSKWMTETNKQVNQNLSSQIKIIKIVPSEQYTNAFFSHFLKKRTEGQIWEPNLLNEQIRIC